MEKNEQLRLYKYFYGYTYKELSEIIGEKQGTVESWVKRKIPADDIKKIEKKLGLEFIEKDITINDIKNLFEIIMDALSYIYDNVYEILFKQNYSLKMLKQLSEQNDDKLSQIIKLQIKIDDFSMNKIEELVKTVFGNNNEKISLLEKCDDNINELVNYIEEKNITLGELYFFKINDRDYVEEIKSKKKISDNEIKKLIKNNELLEEYKNSKSELLEELYLDYLQLDLKDNLDCVEKIKEIDDKYDDIVFNLCKKNNVPELFFDYVSDRYIEKYEEKFLLLVCELDVKQIRKLKKLIDLNDYGKINKTVRNYFQNYETILEKKYCFDYLLSKTKSFDTIDAVSFADYYEQLGYVLNIGFDKYDLTDNKDGFVKGILGMIKLSNFGNEYAKKFIERFSEKTYIKKLIDIINKK